MAVTQTPRLQLQKQDAGNPDWHTALNAGMDNADARLLKVSSDNGDAPDPNVGPIAGDFVGQKYIDETPSPDEPRIWICTTDSTPGPSEWELLSASGIEAPGAGHGGNTNLQTILGDYQARILALETALPVPPRGMIDGMVSSWGTAVTPGDLIDFADGSCGDSTAARYIEPGAMGKKIGSSWVAGDGNGGLSSSLTLTYGEWYHMFAFRTVAAGDDFGFDTSPVAANLITDHLATHFRRVGSFQCQAADYLAERYIQVGDTFTWYDPRYFEVNGGAPFDRTVSWTVDTYTPPDIRALGFFSAYGSDPSGGLQCHLFPMDCYDAASYPPHGRAIFNSSGTWDDIVGHSIPVLTDTSQQINSRWWSGSSLIDVGVVATYGWVDPRGRDN